MEAHRVLVIQDASREIKSSAVKWTVDALSLGPGDELTLLGVLYQVNIPSVFRYIGAAKLMGCNGSIVANPMLHTKQKAIDEEVEGKENEYRDSAELLPISELCEAKRAEKLKATWLILDRGMTRDKKHLVARLSCGISKVNHNNIVELLRGPKTVQMGTESTDLSPKSRIISNKVSTGSEKNTIQVTLSSLNDEDLLSFSLPSHTTVPTTRYQKPSEPIRLK